MRHLAVALVAVLLAGLGAVAPVARPAAEAATVQPKVAIIVGATHSATSTYRTYADQVYAEAIKYTSNVVRVYSPNATWSAVKAAVNGASIVVYMGHGNGWPSPYTYDPNYTTKDGFGLNATAGNGDYNNKYYGEPSIATLTPAANAVVLLFHLCYASGNSEPGDPEPTLSVARQRVDNYAAAFLKTGARAVVVDGHSHSPYYIRALFETDQTIDSYWKGAPSFNGNVASYASVRNPGMTYQMDPDSATSGFYRSIAGDMSLTTTEVTGAPFADTSADPSTYMAPGAASAEVADAPVYATEEDAAAAQAATLSAAAADAGSTTPAPVATLDAGTKLRVSDVASTADAPLIHVTTFDESVTGWMVGDAATPRDSRSPVVRTMSGGGLLTPNDDGDRDTWKLTIGLSETASWTMRIQDGDGKTLKSASGTGTTASLSWDGTVDGSLQPDGTYRWRLTATDAWGNAPLASTSTFVLDHDPIAVTRLAGADRFATSAAISKATFATGVPVVYVANGLYFPDALAGAAAAGTQDVPLLLALKDSIPAVVATELTRLKPAKVVVLGGTAMISDANAAALGAYAGGNVERLAGQDRFATAVAISKASFAPGVPVAYVANGLYFPDALAGAAAAGMTDGPLLLATQDTIPDVVAAELERLAPARIVVLGGPAMVGDATKTALGTYAGGNVTRLAGADRFATSAAISKATFASGADVVYVANGLYFPDALAGAAAAGTKGAPLLLLGQDRITDAVAAELARLAPSRIVVLGGTGMISDATKTALATR